MIGAMLRATPTLVRVGFARTIAYRAEMTIWILTALMPLVMLALWNAVAKDSPVAGYNQAQYALERARGALAPADRHTRSGK